MRLAPRAPTWDRTKDVGKRSLARLVQLESRRGRGYRLSESLQRREIRITGLLHERLRTLTVKAFQNGATSRFAVKGDTETPARFTWQNRPRQSRRSRFCTGVLIELVKWDPNCIPSSGRNFIHAVLDRLQPIKASDVYKSCARAE